ncbi:MAG: ABC transporter permease [Bdellovibrionales bacterium]|nr:ABC transporter permease [Bdellovibrionales bacterium]
MIMWRLAIRNLMRNSRRTSLTVTSIAFGLAVSLWLDCILEGRNRDVIRTVTSGHIGNAQLLKKEYKDEQLAKDFYVAPPEDFLKLLPHGALFARRVHIPALISSGENSSPVLLEGVEPENEAKITKIKSDVIQGDYLSSSEKESCAEKEILIGEKLAKRLNAEVGNKLVLLLQSIDGTLGNDLFFVKGIFSSQSPQFDARYVFTSLPCAQEIAAIRGIHETVFRFQKESDEAAVLKQQGALAGTGLILTTWREAMPSIAVMVKYNKATLLMISVLLLVVIVMGIINTLLMSVYERTREFGVMGALGVTPSELRRLIVLESLVVGIIAAILGTIVGLAMVSYHMKYGLDLRPFLGDSSGAADFKLNLTVYPEFNFIPYLRTVLLTLFFVVAASLYPAIKASRIKPIQAMRSV